MKRITLLLFLPLLLLLPGCSRDPKSYVETGKKYYKNKKYKEASIMYRRALQKDARLAEAWYQLGLTNLQLRNPGEARRNFMRAADLDPKNLDAFAKQADIDLAAYLNDPQRNKPLLSELNGIIDTLFKKDPKSYDAFRLRGYVDLTQQDPKKAIQDFEQANQAKAYQPELMLVLVQTLIGDKQPELAEKYARELIGKQKTYGPMYDALYRDYFNSNRLELAEQILKEKIANNPGQGSNLVELAVHYYRAKRTSDMSATISRLTSDLKAYPNAHMLAGDFYFLIRDYDNALQQYQQGEKDEPKQKAAYQKRTVEILSGLGKNDQAAQLVATILKENPKDPEAIAMHAALLLQTRNPSKSDIKGAIGDLQPLVAKNPANPVLHFNLGRALLANGQANRDAQSIEQARLQFEETVKLQDRREYIPAKMALAELAMNKGESAKAVQNAEDILAVQSTNLGAMLIRSVGLINMHENEKARTQLTSILSAYPTSNDAHYWLGKLDLSEKNYKDAEREFEALKKTNDPRWLESMVEVKVAQNETDSALIMVREQLKQTPDNPVDRLILANIEYRAAKWNDAANDFQKLIEKNPKSADLYIRLGETKRYSGDIKSAADAFENARKLDPSNVMPILQLGMLYDTSGDNEKARRAYEDVLKLQPDNAVALNNLAYAKADDGVDLDQALTYAQRAQQKVPDNPDVIDTLSLIYIKKGNLTDDSIRLLNGLVSRKPERATYHLHLAMAYYQKGDRTAAKKQLDAAAQDKPTEKEQVRIKEMRAKVG